MLASAFILGLLGSFHCVGMCGPIALTLPLPQQNWIYKTSGGVLYNLGRTITYTIMGLLFGLFGQGLALAGFQQWVSIVLGSLMILSLFFPLIFRKVNPTLVGLLQ